MSNNETNRFKMECEICHRSPNTHGITIYRTGEKGPGKNPHWRCVDDLKSIQQVDPGILQIAATIESDNETKH